MNIYWLEQSDADVPASSDWLSANEAIRLGAMRFAKRRADWRLGRWTAKHALAACLHLPVDDASLASLEIRAAASGAPEAFLDGQGACVAISLSHRDGTALCSVGSACDEFGCDLEKIEARSDAFIADYFTAHEHDLITRTPDAQRPLLLALLWSAKESALKALRVGLRVDTRSLSVAPREAGVLPATRAWRPLRILDTGARRFWGWWRVEGCLVRTVVSVAPIDLPRRVPESHPVLESSSFAVGDVR